MCENPNWMNSVGDTRLPIRFSRSALNQATPAVDLRRQEFGGGLSTGMVPIRTITSRTSGVAATALSSACSRSITGLGVADGAQIIVHPTESKPGTPDSAIVGTSGNAGTRAVELTPSGRTLPALMWLTTLPAS